MTEAPDPVAEVFVERRRPSWWDLFWAGVFVPLQTVNMIASGIGNATLLVAISLVLLGYLAARAVRPGRLRLDDVGLRHEGWFRTVTRTWTECTWMVVDGGRVTGHRLVWWHRGPGTARGQRLWNRSLPGDYRGITAADLASLMNRHVAASGAPLPPSRAWNPFAAR